MARPCNAAYIGEARRSEPEICVAKRNQLYLTAEQRHERLATPKTSVSLRFIPAVAWLGDPQRPHESKGQNHLAMIDDLRQRHIFLMRTSFQPMTLIALESQTFNCPATRLRIYLSDLVRQRTEDDLSKDLAGKDRATRPNL